MTRAHEAVAGSSALKQVLKAVLAVGNAMNEGTSKGGASGCTLDSLLRLSSTKARDKKSTLLDYVSEVMARRVRRRGSSRDLMPGRIKEADASGQSSPD